ncbi:MAG: hypothetical protein K2X82_07930 [Gemmataceae bacterium]|nr:hypothetical protein [Gemmataceae bacterium]
MADALDPRCVGTAGDLAGANALAEWLGRKGFACEVVPPPAVPPAGDALGFTEPPPPVIEVRVLDVDQAEPARATIAEAREELREVQERLLKRAARTGTVSATCEECRRSSDWPAASAGSTQDCPHCGAYMDIPDPEAEGEWSGVDFGAEDGEDEAGGKT